MKLNKDTALLTGNYLELFGSTKTRMVTVQKFQRVVLEVHMGRNGQWLKFLQYWKNKG
jgi:hypothetical protein